MQFILAFILGQPGFFGNSTASLVSRNAFGNELLDDLTVFSDCRVCINQYVSGPGNDGSSSDTNGQRERISLALKGSHVADSRAGKQLQPHPASHLSRLLTGHKHVIADV